MCARRLQVSVLVKAGTVHPSVDDTARRSAICIINYGIIAIDRRSSLPLALARLHLLTDSIYYTGETPRQRVSVLCEVLDLTNYVHSKCVDQRSSSWTWPRIKVISSVLRLKKRASN